MKLAYTGHRDFQVSEEIRSLIMEDLQNPAVDEVIVGGARGFDLFVGKLARIIEQKRSYWFRVTAFSRLAEICGEYLKTGVKVGVRGQLVSRNWDDSVGNKHSTVEICARELELLGNNHNGSGNGNVPTGEDDSDIPF